MMFQRICFVVLCGCISVIGSITFAGYQDTVQTTITQRIQQFVQHKDPQQAITSLLMVKKVLQAKESTFSASTQWIVNIIIQRIDDQVVVLRAQGNPTEGSTDIYDVTNIDIARVKRTRLKRYNQERLANNLSAYSYDTRLDRSAQAWANALVARYKGTRPNFGDIHKRNLHDQYYDYKKITDWMADHGIIAKNIGGRTFSENIGYGYVACPSIGDCTDAMIEGIHTTMDFFLGEKTTGGVHYQSMVSRYFTKIGLGLAQDESNHYWIVVHYATQLE